MTDFSGIHDGDHVEISLATDTKTHSEGKVLKILKNTNPCNVSVLLTNGNHGTVVKIINSEEIIKERIMHEDQYSENKMDFIKDIMRNDVIPKTIQSFLNSLGGYLYIGIRDQGSLEERLVGISHDFEAMSKGIKMTNDKLCDKFELDIMHTLNKHLKSDVEIGPLVKINFVTICNVQIVEIAIKQSPSPWFFKNIGKNGKQKQYKIQYGNDSVMERILDDFYIRRGNGKVQLQTHEEFHDYVKSHYK